MHPKYRESVDKLSMWSLAEKNIHAAIILGSQVRDEFEGDEWSDLDVLLLADHPQIFLQTDTWLAFLGEIVCVITEETNLDWVHLTWSVKRVLFTDNRTIDFSIMPYDRIADVLELNAEIHAHGYQVIYDAHTELVASKIEASLLTVKEEPAKLPTENDLHQTIDDLLFQLIFAAKKVKRNELWVAVSCINQRISNRLLQLIEFHTASIAKVSQRIRYDGRFLEQRTHQDILKKLPECFAKYDTLDAIKTIDHLLEVIHCLSEEICKVNRYSLNQDQFDRARRLYDEMFRKATPTLGLN